MLIAKCDVLQLPTLAIGTLSYLYSGMLFSAIASSVQSKDAPAVSV